MIIFSKQGYCNDHFKLVKKVADSRSSSHSKSGLSLQIGYRLLQIGAIIANRFTASVSRQIKFNIISKKHTKAQRFKMYSITNLIKGAFQCKYYCLIQFKFHSTCSFIPQVFITQVKQYDVFRWVLLFIKLLQVATSAYLKTSYIR